ncbi:hypothetical protein HPP92_017667 [Vanilla planifolia]|uniref:non-specific serine/threonine protein kinase n=1 Tax=Vanilla planifolia TaxID=51239 RepID=A0A835UM55_VANPL|nr:hypothetical protein HPP92_017667 [Vanilla planifolia]
MPTPCSLRYFNCTDKPSLFSHLQSATTSENAFSSSLPFSFSFSLLAFDLGSAAPCLYRPPPHYVTLTPPLHVVLTRRRWGSSFSRPRWGHEGGDYKGRAAAFALDCEVEVVPEGLFIKSMSSLSGNSLNDQLSQKTDVLGLKLWVVIGIGVGVLILCVLCVLVLCLATKNRKRLKTFSNNLPATQIPMVSKEIKEVKLEQVLTNDFRPQDGILHTIQERSGDKDSDKAVVHLGLGESTHVAHNCHSRSFNHADKETDSQSAEEGNSESAADHKPYSSYPITAPSPLIGLPEFSHIGWGHWFTLRDLEISTNRFSKENVIGEGGYGVVYHGCLINGTPVAIKRLLNNVGQAEKEFRMEVEAIGHARHKNLVRLLGYCVEGTQRMLVYEYVNNGNLEQWLHGALFHHGSLTWEARIKVLLGTAKALAYLHESIEPKVVHRDIKSSNILIDDDFNAKVSDFGLAKLLGAGKSHITTRVMGTFGYVAPEYANTGLLNEKSDVYSFGVVLLEAITGRDPVDYGRPTNEVNLVDWLKMMVGCRRSEEVLDPNIESKPSTRALKRALLTALRCVDSDAKKRPSMSLVVRMLESEEPMSRVDWRHHRTQNGSTNIESQSKNSNTIEL